MYTLLKAYVKHRQQRGRWVEEAVGHLTMMTLFQQFRAVWLVLSHPTLSQPVTLDIAKIDTNLLRLSATLTVNEWLSAAGNRTLPAWEGVPTPSVRYGRYMNAWQAGYRIEPAPREEHYTNERRRADTPDLRMTRSGVTGHQAQSALLVSVNGLFHTTHSDEDALYVVDGAKSGFHADNNNVGLYQIGRVGKVQYVPITKDNLYPPTGNTQLRDRAYIRIDADLRQKSVALVLGGYLHLIPNCFFRVSANTYAIKMNDIPLIDRFYESSQLLDLSPVWDSVEHTDHNAHQFVVDQLLSDDVLLQYLTLPQSFFVVIDTPEFFVETQGVERHELPGVASMLEAPSGLLRTSTGLALPYWMKQEDHRWVINAGQQRRPNALRHQYPAMKKLSIDDSWYPYRDTSPMSYYFQHVGVAEFSTP